MYLGVFAGRLARVDAIVACDFCSAGFLDFTTPLLFFFFAFFGEAAIWMAPGFFSDNLTTVFATGLLFLVFAFFARRGSSLSLGGRSKSPVSEVTLGGFWDSSFFLLSDSLFALRLRPALVRVAPGSELA